ncbi:MAG: hypothetical protein R3C05_15370 [Pirellulaceae bacterium]
MGSGTQVANVRSGKHQHRRGIARLKQETADLLVVCDYGQILSSTALGVPFGGSTCGSL